MSRQIVDIIPALMPKSFFELEQYAKQFQGVVDTVQVDVMDGNFVSEVSWPYAGVGVLEKTFKEIVGKDRELPEKGVLNYELDLMVQNPESSIKSWMQTGASRVIFHIESISDNDWFWKNIAHVKSPFPELGVSGVEIGIAIGIETSNEDIYPYIEKIDFIQCMGIEKIGFQGQSFDERVLHKVDDLRKRFPKLIISIDGGVNLDTAPRLIEAGANRLVSGSTILKSDNVGKTIKELQGL